MLRVYKCEKEYGFTQIAKTIAVSNSVNRISLGLLLAICKSRDIIILSTVKEWGIDMKRVTSIIMVLAMLVSLIPVNVSADGLQEEPSQEVVQQEHSEQQSEEALEADSQEQTPEEEPKEGSQEPLPEEDLKEEPQIPEKEPEVPAILTWEEYCYTLLADGSVSICGFEGAPENEEEPFLVEIPSEINGSKVTELAEKAFAGNAEIEGVLLPETIQTIGSGAFEDCGNLRVIAFCGDTPSFEESLAKGSEKLTEIDILEKWDFYALAELLEKDLGENAAANITFQSFETVASLEEAFAAQNQPEPEESESIQDDAGTQTGQGYVTYTTGEDDGTGDATVVASGTCGENLTWTLDAEGLLTITGSGAMAGYNYELVPWYSERERITQVSLPEGLTRIGYDAFRGCSSLTSIMIPDGVTSIGGFAFYECSSLTNITIPDGVTSIDEFTFCECSSLTGITIPDSVTSIGDAAFWGCSGLTSITIPDGVTSIGDYAFYKCSSLTSITIPDGVTSIGYATFQGCSSLTSITMPNNMTSIGERVFDGCSSLTSITIPDGVTSIGARTFYECSNITSISIPDSVTSIGDYAFYKCSSLTSITIPDSVTSIGDYAFYKCSSLTSITIPDSVTSIGDYAFPFCSSLTSITIPDGVTSIGDYAFYKCSSLTNITIPDSVTSIGYYAFYECISLTSITIPDSVTSIDNDAFPFCSSLTSITIPDSVTSIGYYAFAFCDGLKEIIFEGDAPQFRSEIFHDVTATAYYPAGNATWTEEVRRNYGGTITWVADKPGSSEEPDNEYADAKLVLYFRAWNPEEKLVYWGNLLGLLLDNESQVTEETDTSFLDHLDQLVGKYVLVELKYRTDNLIGPNTLIRIQPVETRVGTVSALDGNTMTIDGKDYTVPEDLTLPTVYVNTRVLYHFDDNGIQGIERLSVKKGTLSGWDAQTQEMAIRPENGLSPSLYTLSPLADEETVAYLRSYFSGACRSVCYYFDDNKFVYRIVEGPPSYNVPPEYVKPDPLQDYLVSYQNEWETAYRNLMDAVKQALDEFAGNPEVEKQDAIAAEALRMKTHDDASFSKYISGTLGPYEDVAYQALAQYFYEEISQYSIPDLSSIDISGSMAGTQIVNNVLKNIGGESKEYTIDGIHIQIVPAILGMGAGFGKMVIDENTTVVFCSTQDQCREIIGEYLKELQDLATNSTYNVVSAVYQDILGKPISSLTKEYVTQVANKIEKKLAVSLAEKFSLAGVGDLFQTLDTCYTYYTWAKKAVNTANTDDIQAAVNNIMNLNFEDTSIKNAAVKSAMKKLNSASSKLTRAFNEYLDGTIEEKENSFWRLLFGCPVNISVFNSSGEQIGYISDDDIWYTSAVKINRLGSAKEIIVLDHDTPSFVISATDYGEMSCSFEEYDSNFLPIGRLNYYSIPLTPGQDFSVTLVDNLEAHAEELAIESNGELIYPDEYIPVTQNAAVSISCNFEGIDEGTVYGTGVYVCGEAVLLSAVPQDGYQFVGWYDDGNLVCESPSYEFTARTDKTLTAKFCEKTESVQIDVIYDEGGFAMGGGTYSKNREVALLAIPYDAYSFTGWYRDGQLVSGSAEYSIHADTDVILEARFAKHEHLYDTPTFSWAEDYSCTATFTCVDGDDVQTIDCTVTSTTTPATETAAGKTVYTATVDLDGQTYMDTRVVTIPPTNHTAHVADTTWHFDGTSHWHECTVCSEKMDVIRHSGGTATCTKQAECEICGIAYGDLAPHDYETAWTQAGEVGHWHVCKNCSAHDSVVPHVPGAAATATTAQTCIKCGFVIASATSHTHTTDSTWHSNGTYHWHLCTSCGAWVSTSQHSYSSDADTICNVCGYTRTVNATEPTAATEEAVAETENPHISENTTATEALKPTTEASQGNDEVSISNDGVDNSDPNSFGVSGILIAALVIIMVGSLAGLAMLFIYKRRHD